VSAHLLALIFINMTGHMALSGGRMSGSLHILRSGHSAVVVGVFMALFALMPVVASLQTGRWVDRVGSAKVMRFGVGFVCLGAFLPVALLNVPSLFVAALLIGFGFNMVTMSAQHAVGHLADASLPARRLANFGWYAMGHSASSVLGPLLCGLIIDAIGFRSAFAAMASFTLVTVFLILRTANNLPVSKVPEQVLLAPSAPKPHVMDLLATVPMRRIYWVNALSAASWDLFVVMLPVLGFRLGFSASVIGTVFSMFALGTFTARAAMPMLSRYFNEWHILRTNTVVIALVYAALPWATLAGTLMALALVFGLAVGMSQPNALSLLHGTAPQGRAGEAMGLRAVINNTCSVVVPVLFGAGIGAFGMAPLLWASSALFMTAVYPAHKALQAYTPHR
jgi:MFS family permease